MQILWRAHFKSAVRFPRKAISQICVSSIRDANNVVLFSEDKTTLLNTLYTMYILIYNHQNQKISNLASDRAPNWQLWQLCIAA